ncbi:glycoside hydrolase family 16 protein [Tulasnella calospora MUT 4182]|uniref:Eukaryotic translation initiation factor 3 subunit M n=1 Tax=Tulasnella calospora MUT 4182 TaxID=1051891 RepID=A0A0C3LB33_9AGAM|nr:glycoside hydrolase family 16 protein [Tulasnella calospora MUT 4182]
MASSDSTLIFGDGTFEEQIQELVNYLARDLADDARTSFISPFQNALLSSDESRKQKTITLVLGAVKGLGSGSEKEIEGFFNLLYAHVLALFPDEAGLKEQLTPIIHTISVAPNPAIIKYRILTNLFNILPRSSPLRLQVYQALVALVTSQDELDLLGVKKADIERWISEWNVTAEEQSSLWKSLSDAFSKCGPPERFLEFQLSFISSLPQSSTEVQPAILVAIATALKTPSMFDLDTIKKLPSLKLVQSTPLFGLLQVFLNGDYAQLSDWLSKNGASLGDSGLDKDILERKIRLLSIAALATQNVGKDLPYSAIASTLQVPAADVENWAIDAMRANLIGGKLSQPTQTLHVTRAAHRSFSSEDWAHLEKRLVNWRADMAAVLDVLAHTKQSRKPRAAQDAEILAEKTVQAAA